MDFAQSFVKQFENINDNATIVCREYLKNNEPIHFNGNVYSYHEISLERISGKNGSFTVYETCELADYIININQKIFKDESATNT